MGSNREKSIIAIAILEKYNFLRVSKIISHFDGSNNIFVYCIKNITSSMKRVWLQLLIKYKDKQYYVPKSFKKAIKTKFLL